MIEEIEKLYEVFSKYHLKEKIEGCPCCGVEKQARGLHSKVLRKLGWEELGVFTFKAMTTFGDLNDFKHFLPRIFELYTQGIYDAPNDVGILFSKLEYAQWLCWPDCEKEAIISAINIWLLSLKNSGTDSDLEVLSEIKQDMKVYEFNFNA